MKIEKDIIENVLTERLHDEEAIREIMTALEQRAQEERPPRDPTETQEKRNVTVLLCSEDDVPLAAELSDRITAVTFQIVDQQNHNELIDSVLRGARSYNENKRPASRLRNFAEACEKLSPKRHLESFPKRIYTKEPALVIASTNAPV